MTARDGADEPTREGAAGEPEAEAKAGETAEVVDVAEPDADAETAPDADSDAEPDWVRRRRLDAVFGDGAHGQALGDRWYQEQVPPHHG